MSTEDARDVAGQMLLKIKGGVDPKFLSHLTVTKNVDVTLEKVLIDFLQDRSLKERTSKEYRYQITRAFKDWLQRPVSMITKDEVREWYVAGRETQADTDNTFRILKSMMNYAVGREWIDDNPCKIISVLKLGYRKQRRTTSLSIEHELPQFIRAFVDFQPIRRSQVTGKDYLTLLLWHGYRAGEARHIRWRDVDFDKRSVTIPDPKNHEPHILPLTEVPHFLFLTRRRELPDNIIGTDEYLDHWVFPNRSGTGPITDVRKTAKTIFINAGIPRYTPHDIRRTFASTLNYMGVGYADLKALLNHKTKDITETYIQPQRLAEQLESVGDMYEAFYTGETIERVRERRNNFSKDSVIRLKLFSKRLHGEEHWSRKEAMEAFRLWAEEDAQMEMDGTTEFPD